jgi:sugar/nucleoside kinase (ribokinase family)
MERTWIGEQKVIKGLGRTFVDCEQAADAVVQAEWANKILSAPDYVFPNGRDAHVVAGETLDAAEDVLLEFQLFS